MEKLLDKDYIDSIKSIFKEDNLSKFREDFLSYHPFELSEAFLDFNEDERYRVYGALAPDELAAIFQHMDVDDVVTYFSEMNSLYISQVLQEMDIDDAVDIIKEVDDKDKIISYLSVMDKEIAKEIRKLLQYDEETAGSIMTTNYIEISVNFDVKQAMRKMINEANEAETIYVIYVTDENKKLVGTLSLKQLVLARAHEKIEDIMNDRVISVLASTDQEDVAQIMQDYDFLAIPVVDYQNHIIGIITIDDVVDVITEEAGEDYERLAAVTDIDEMTDNTVVKNAFLRLPWLLLLLLLGMLNASLLSYYNSTLTQMVALSYFLPLIAGMAGNTGTQSLAITIRNLATEELSSGEKIVHIFKEASTGLIIGVVSSLSAFGLVYFMQRDVLLAFLVAISILVSLIVATFTGAAIPLLMEKLKVDPAVASGPFITTINDLISMTIYLGLATWAISQLI